MTSAVDYDITSPAYALSLFERAEDAHERMAGQRHILIDAKIDAQNLAQLRDARESTIAINGGITDEESASGEAISTNGSNEAERKHRLNVAISNDTKWLRLDNELREAKRKLAIAETEEGIASDEYGLCRTMLNAVTAHVTRLSTVESGQAYERKVYR